MLRKKGRKEKETNMGGKKEKKRQDKAKEVLTIENKRKLNV